MHFECTADSPLSKQYGIQDDYCACTPNPAHVTVEICSIKDELGILFFLLHFVLHILHFGTLSSSHVHPPSSHRVHCVGLKAATLQELGLRALPRAPGTTHKPPRTVDSDVEPILGLSFVESDGVNISMCIISRRKVEENGGVLRAVPALRARCAQSLYRTMPNLHSGAQYP